MGVDLFNDGEAEYDERWPAEAEEDAAWEEVIDTTPAVAASIQPEVPKQVPRLSSYDQLSVQLDDMRYVYNVLDKLENAWDQEMDINDLCKLSTTTLLVLNQRRKILNLDVPTGHNTNKKIFFSPYDD